MEIIVLATIIYTVYIIIHYIPVVISIRVGCIHVYIHYSLIEPNY